MPSKVINLTFNGLVTDMGALAAPGGAMTQANNVWFPAPGIVVKRKGINRTAANLGGPIWEMIDSPMYKTGQVFASFGSTTAATGLRLTDGTSSTLLTLPNGQGVAQSSTNFFRERMALLNYTHYFTSSNGPAALIYGLTTPFFAGAPKAPGFDSARATGVLTGTGGQLADGYSTAYRVVWGYRKTLPDNTVIEVVGSPSGRTVINNISGTTGYAAGVAKNVILRVLLPKHVRTNSTAISTDFFFRVFRAGNVEYANAIPSDEMAMVYQANVTAGQIAAGYVEITDSCPEAATGAFLYTNSIVGGDNATQSIVYTPKGTPGISTANDPPPDAREVASFAGCLFYGNIRTPSRITLSLVALPTAGTDIQINGVTFTAVSGAPASASEFRVVTGGTVSQNLQATALNLVEAINANSSNTYVWAIYTGNDASPGTVGQFVVEGRTVSDDVTIVSSISSMEACFLPRVPVNGVGSLTATWQSQSNGLAISKIQQGDAVPVSNYLNVGPNSATILAMVALREALYIFTDVGLYWLRGNTPSDFSLDLLDPTFRLWGQRGVVNMGDRLYAWGREGIAEITSSGTRYIDAPIRSFVQSIEQDLGYDTGRGAPYICDYFALGYRSARRVMFFYPGANTSRGCNQALCWNAATETWSTFNTYADLSCAAVRTTDELAFHGDWNNTGADGHLFIDRNAGTLADYNDAKTDGSSAVIPSALTWHDQAPDPTTLMRWQEMSLFLSPSTFDPVFQAFPAALVLGAETEVQTTTTVTANPSTLSVRWVLPKTHALGVRFTPSVSHSTASDYFAITGVSLLYTPCSTGATK